MCRRSTLRNRRRAASQQCRDNVGRPRTTTIYSNNRGTQATTAYVQQYSSRKKNVYQRTFSQKTDRVRLKSILR